MRSFLVTLSAVLGIEFAVADIYGSRASFLIFPGEGMSLSYLSSSVNDAWRRKMENKLLSLGDTHIYIYSQNEADDVGKVSPQPDWEKRLDHLNNIGLRPIMWLMADDSPSLSSRPLSAHKAHNAEMVRRFDDKVDAYVIGLEVDEYWSSSAVAAMITHLKTLTDKPVAVHMTSKVGGHKKDISYYEHADIIFLQTGWVDEIGEKEFRKRVAEAIALGKPVVVAEYSLSSDSAKARRYGDIACEMGAVGTGNGRNVTACGQREVVQKKKPWYQRYEREIGVVGIAMASAFAVSYWDLPLTLNATESSLQIGVTKDFENSSVGVSLRDDGAVMGHYRFSF